MLTASCLIRLHLPESRSLKDKRQVVRSLVHRLRERFNVSAIEAADLDLLQSAVLGVALVARDRAEAETELRKIGEAVESWSGLKYVDFDVAWL